MNATKSNQNIQHEIREKIARVIADAREGILSSQTITDEAEKAFLQLFDKTMNGVIGEDEPKTTLANSSYEHHLALIKRNELKTNQRAKIPETLAKIKEKK